MIKMAKHNNPIKAGKYPETREGLLALEELDLSDCSLTGIPLACVAHSHFTKPKGVCVGRERGRGVCVVNTHQDHLTLVVRYLPVFCFSFAFNMVLFKIQGHYQRDFGSF